MKNKSKKATLYALLASLVLASTGCSYRKNENSSLDEYFEELEKENHKETLKFKMEDALANIEKASLNIMQIVKENDLFKEIPSVIALEGVNIRKSPNTDGELAGKLVEGHTLEMVEKLSNGWYKVLYYGEERYVSGDFVSETTTYQVNGEIKKVCYATDEIEMTIPKEVSKSGVEEKVTIPSLECLEIYEENADNYLVQTNDYIGYVAKTSLEELTGVFVVVDISDQELKLYENNKVILKTPVITGNVSEKDCASDEDLFKIYAFKTNDYLRGPGYEAYVKEMMYYNRGEGIHDASWRSDWQYGGDTYLTNGSHGCINTPPDAAMIVYEYVEKDTPVLVHK